MSNTPTILIQNYYQDIYITIGETVNQLYKSGRQAQVSTLLYYLHKCESHAQCMDVIARYVKILEAQES